MSNAKGIAQLAGVQHPRSTGRPSDATRSVQPHVTRAGGGPDVTARTCVAVSSNSCACGSNNRSHQRPFAVFVCFHTIGGAPHCPTAPGPQGDFRAAHRQTTAHSVGQREGPEPQDCVHCQRPHNVIPCMNFRPIEVFLQCGYLWRPGCHQLFPNSTFQQQISLPFRPLCLLCIQPMHEALNSNSTRFWGCAKWVDGRLCRGNLSQLSVLVGIHRSVQVVPVRLWYTANVAATCQNEEALLLDVRSAGICRSGRCLSPDPQLGTPSP